MKLVAILSAKYSGSTLLDFMLGSHSHALSMTELRAFVSNGRTPFTCKSCIPADACMVWTPDLTSRLVAMGPSTELYRAIHQQSGAPVLVDSSKNVPWFEATLADMKPQEVLCILISKPPEGYMASERNKSHTANVHDIDEIADRWWRSNAKFLDFMADNAYQSAVIRYQDLIDAPRQVLTYLLEKLDMNYEADQEHFWNFELHPLWGNKGTRSHLNQTDSNPERWSDSSNYNKELYKAQHQTLFRDEKWRDTLTREEVDNLYRYPRVVSIAQLLGYANPFTEMGEKLNQPVRDWQPKAIIGSPEAAQERHSRRRDFMSWDLVHKAKKMLIKH